MVCTFFSIFFFLLLCCCLHASLFCPSFFYLHILTTTYLSLSTIKRAIIFLLDFLRTIFLTLYDEEVVDEDCIQIWVDDNTELTGKGDALYSVQKFLDWLDEGLC